MCLFTCSDVQLSRKLGPLQINLRVDNALQYYYATIERKIRPLRRNLPERGWCALTIPIQLV